MDELNFRPTRIIIRACVTDVPGDPQARFQTLGNLFCEQFLRRPFNPQLQVDSYDHMYIPPGFDSDQSLRRWFIYDFNVTGMLSSEELLVIPHMVFQASRQDDKWIFIPRERWIEEAKKRCSSYVWGGRAEQNMVAEMRRAQNIVQEPEHGIADSG
ncbi:MAG: hypothetical protein M1816_008208 [Peltula sp. TS41687]|nr:MAG: hypothetical protein M1816_008208 [Peltula sp. TS41687]